MRLAEALLRVPDATTADRLIEDKLATGDWSGRDVKSNTFLVSASAWTLGITARIIQPGETPDTILDTLIKRLGLPAVRTATRQAMRLLGSHFVLGQTIEEALDRAADHQDSRYSFDMLGEGARTATDADRYFDAYAAAIAAIGASAGEAALPNRRDLSQAVALHPRFEASRPRAYSGACAQALELARKARDHDLNFTVDAEEADRLELTLDVIAAVLADSSLRGWEGFGLAVQAYQKRASAVIDWLAEEARLLHRRLMVRLVKGAYWDTEVKRAQERGLADYPVFTRKAMTDLSYLQCTRKLLAAREQLYHRNSPPTMPDRRERDPGRRRRHGNSEFQRLHGMGEVLYETLTRDLPGSGHCGVYAPLAAIAICWPIWCAGCSGERHAILRSWRSRPTLPCRSRPSCGGRRAGSATLHAYAPSEIPLPRDLYGSSGAIHGRRRVRRRTSFAALCGRGS
jgi:RHH-type proline utilization regulon transcriptional repressor/proline dehydrogenase/delta 1-pyrroline-5-carboxylate dehydrogenase